MEYNFTHKAESLLGRLEREWHERVIQSTETLDLSNETISLYGASHDSVYMASRGVKLLHISIKEYVDSWTICRDMVTSVATSNELRNQLGRKLTEVRIKNLRAPEGSEKIRCIACEGVFTQAFWKIAEGMEYDV